MLNGVNKVPPFCVTRSSAFARLVGCMVHGGRQGYRGAAALTSKAVKEAYLQLRGADARQDVRLQMLNGDKVLAKVVSPCQ